MCKHGIRRGLLLQVSNKNPTVYDCVSQLLYRTYLFTVSNTYLGEFLAQLQQEGYSIFIVKGNVSTRYHQRGHGDTPN